MKTLWEVVYDKATERWKIKHRNLGGGRRDQKGRRMSKKEFRGNKEEKVAGILGEIKEELRKIT